MDIIDIIDRQVIPVKGGRYRNVQDTTSKTFRVSIHSRDIIREYKSGIKTEGGEIEKIIGVITRDLRSIRHKTWALRILHGDVYSMDRMHKFGMVENGACNRCGNTETINHLLLECEYVKKCWAELSLLTGETEVVRSINDVFTRKEPIYAIEMCCRLAQKDRPIINPTTLAKSIERYVNLRLVGSKGRWATLGASCKNF